MADENLQQSPLVILGIGPRATEILREHGMATLADMLRRLSALPDGTYLKVRRVNPSGTVRLLHLYRTRTGRDVVADLVDVPKSALPAGTRVADVLRYEAGALARTDLSARDVARLKFEAVVELRNLELEESRDEIETVVVVESCDSDEAGQAAFDVDEEEDDQLDNDLREFAEAHGWSPPDPGDLAVSVDIGPHTAATLTLRVERYSAWMEAEMWATRPDGTEAQVGLLFGSYERNVRIVDVDAEAAACAEPAPEHEVDLRPGDVIV